MKKPPAAQQAAGGFDFRPENVRTFADDMASKDAIQRAADFIAHHLGD